MTTRVEILEWIAYTGFVLAAAGFVSIFVKYNPLWLLYIGLLAFFFGYYFRHSESEFDEIVKKEQGKVPP